VREIVADSVAGRVVESREPAAFACAVGELLASPPGPAAVRRYAERFGWEEVARAQVDLYRAVVEEAAAC
jgi:glycosyltransferase involved in cell wall biosynthesis